MAYEKRNIKLPEERIKIYRQNSRYCIQKGLLKLMYRDNLNKKNQITVIIPLYKTPIKKIKVFDQYKNYRLIVLDQCPDKQTGNKIKKLNLEYYSIKKNIGLSRATNFLLSKVKTKYCLFTQADIVINSKSIDLLRDEIEQKKNIIFSGPKFVKKFISKNITVSINKSKIINNLNAACMMCHVKKLRKIGFFDNDFFLYWEDIFLMDKIKKSKYKMLYVPNALAIHDGGKSTKKNFKIQFIRTSNFKYGELLYAYKLNKNIFLKIVRQIIQNTLFLTLNTVIFNINKILKNLAILTGILKFIKFYSFKKISSLLNL